MGIAKISGGNIVKPISITGDTATHFFAIVNIPPLDLSPGTRIEGKGRFSGNSSNGKTMQAAIAEGKSGGDSGGGGLVFSAGGIGLNGEDDFAFWVMIRSITTQIGGPINSTSGWGNTGSQPNVFQKNMRNGLDLVIQGSLSNAADILTLENFSWQVSSS